MLFNIYSILISAGTLFIEEGKSIAEEVIDSMLRQDSYNLSAAVDGAFRCLIKATLIHIHKNGHM